MHYNMYYHTYLATGSRPVYGYCGVKPPYDPVQKFGDFFAGANLHYVFFNFVISSGTYGGSKYIILHFINDIIIYYGLSPIHY